MNKSPTFNVNASTHLYFRKYYSHVLVLFYVESNQLVNIK